MTLFALQDTKVLWYLTRGAGAAATFMLTASVVLGVLTSIGARGPSFPRFVVQGLHRNVSLLVLAFIGAHLATTIIDGFVSIGWFDAVVPFRSGYHPLWTGLGTLALDLLLAVVVTSLWRDRIGYLTWRRVHWLAYAAWPVAMIHGLMIGTDRHAGWMTLVNLGCALAVVAAVGARLWTYRPADQPVIRKPTQVVGR